MLKIGPYEHPSKVIVAPMAGVTDRPFRSVCRSHGAYWMISEMVTSRADLWSTSKSQARLPDINEKEPRWVQIMGTDPAELAFAARSCVEMGAQILDINMGCPAKKVCGKMAGSALLRDEKLVADILSTVVNSVDVPVTLKMRLGWSKKSINGVSIAKIAEDSGIQLISVHGRTRACRFTGEVDYDSIGEIKSTVGVPVIANGDIVSIEQAELLMEDFGFDGLMIGRACLGQPWLVSQISAALNKEKIPPSPALDEFRDVLTNHLSHLIKYYGENRGMRIARKHIGWYLRYFPNGLEMARRFNLVPTYKKQLDFILNSVGSSNRSNKVAA